MQNTTSQFITAANAVPTPAAPEDLVREVAFSNYKLQIAEKRIAEQEAKIRELETLASTDFLTGLLNRRSFEKAYAQEQARMRRYSTPGGMLLLFDLDKFKQINDTHGHQTGDACLKAVADYLKSRLRPMDVAARLGGDEFAVLLSNTNATPAHIAQDIRNALSHLEVEHHGEKLNFSVSVGACPVTLETTYEKAYLAADRNLYIHKGQKTRFF